MKPNKELLDLLNFPECGVTKHFGVWYEADKMVVATTPGDYLWDAKTRSLVEEVNFVAQGTVCLKLKLTVIPPKPETYHSHNGDTYELTGEVNNVGCPYVIEDGSGIHTSSYRNINLYHGLRWLVRKIEPQPLPGRNPSKATALPCEGARIVEEEELKEFKRCNTTHKDLYSIIINGKTWYKGARGDGYNCTYATTRKENWWKVESKPLTMADVPVGAVVRFEINSEWDALVTEKSSAQSYVNCSKFQLSYEVYAWRWPQETEWRTK